jgi:hypothetical protein
MFVNVMMHLQYNYKKYKRKQRTTNPGENTRKKEPLYTVGGNIN